MTTKTDEKQEAASTDSARAAGAPSSPRDPGPRSTAAERAERWHREKRAASAAAQQKRDVENAEFREADRERGRRLEADVQLAIELHDEKLGELRRAEGEVQKLRRERDRGLEVILAKIDRRAELLPEQYRAALARSADRLAESPYGAANLPAVAELGFWLTPDGEIDRSKIEGWKRVVAAEAEKTDSISTRPKRDVAKDLGLAEKAIEAARKSERAAHEALGAARKSLYDWSAGR